MHQSPSTRHGPYVRLLLLACLSAACLAGPAQAEVRLSATAHEPAQREAPNPKASTRTLTLGDARYAIPDAFFYGPLETAGDRQRAVLFSAWLSEVSPPGTRIVEVDDPSEAAARRLVILVESMQVYPDTARRDNLLANYRAYAGDLDINGSTSEAARELSPALGGLQRVVLRDPAAIARARYPDLFIEGDERHPTTVLGCSRPGVRGVSYAVCSLHFRVEGADISVDMKREHMAHWRMVRGAVTDWMARYRIRTP
ncbi:hypothetical protein [Pigmentiphaga aceris]|nr:hypothetical protein [Pigmentiphaga aceris]